ncbi:photosystem reaction center subunit H, partial [Streptomyces sp. SID13666]|nr:photosystem reaction center subunit H [Streptomyces sp. SID13666]
VTAGVGAGAGAAGVTGAGGRPSGSPGAFSAGDTAVVGTAAGAPGVRGDGWRSVTV